MKYVIKMDKYTLSNYIDDISSKYEDPNSTELSYRTFMENLLREILPKDVKVLHEGKREKYGVPDFRLFRNNVPIAFIETKDIDDSDLEGKKLSGNKQQFDKYKAALSTIVFTNYTDFLLYEDGQLTVKASIGVKEDGKITLTQDAKQLKYFQDIVAKIGNAKPQKIRGAEKLVNIMSAKAKIIADIILHAIKDDNKKKKGELKDLQDKFDVLKNILVHDMSEDIFADFYAQIIVYGMFIARYNDHSGQDFTKERAVKLIPDTNPFLKKVFSSIAIASPFSDVEWIVDDMASVFNSVEMNKVMRNFNVPGKPDPILYFYEEFVKVYDPQIRETFGVWYTPQEVVNFIVSSVDEILKTSFGVTKGIADNSMINDEYHRVQILDPATGTGTFITEIVNRIYNEYKEKNELVYWPEDVVSNIIPRIYGFEYLVAPYTIANLKLSTAFRLEQVPEEMIPERLQIYLTNSLDNNINKSKAIPFDRIIREEAEAAYDIKNNTRIMVILGNPPYNEKSANKGEWIEGLMHDYKQEPGKKGSKRRNKKGRIVYTDTLEGEKNPKPLNNDYCKFIRLGQEFLKNNDEGILAYITANTFLDTALFRGMRYELLSRFDEIHIINLHGSSKREEKGDERRDECIFKIQVGVSINIFIKKKNEGDKKLARVYYKDIENGKRDFKLEQLSGQSIYSIGTQEIIPEAPYYNFRPIKTSNELKNEYKSGIVLKELFGEINQGFKTNQDNFAIWKKKAEVEAIIQDFANPIKNDSLLKKTYGIEDKRDWQLAKARKGLPKEEARAKYITEIQYRPFDVRWTMFHKTLVTYPRPLFQNNVLNKENLVLGVGRQGNVRGDADWSLAIISDLPLEMNTAPRGGVYAFPLFLYKDGIRIRNLKDTEVEKIEQNICLSMQDVNDTKRKDGGYLAEDIVYYIYAVLHSDIYRKRYHELLQNDFPIIPYPKDKEMFLSLADLGKKLKQLHLLEDIPEDAPSVLLPSQSSEFRNRVEDINVVSDGPDKLRVYFNSEQFFGNISVGAWNLEISGYRAAEHWLIDRKKKKDTLENADIKHFCKMIYALDETIKIKNEIDNIMKESKV